MQVVSQITELIEVILIVILGLQVISLSYRVQKLEKRIKNEYRMEKDRVQRRANKV